MYSKKTRVTLLCAMAVVASLLIWRAGASLGHDTDEYSTLHHQQDRIHVHVDDLSEDIQHDVARLVEEVTAHVGEIQVRVHAEIEIDDDKGDPIVKKTFKVQTGGLLEVEVPDADVEVLPGTNDEAEITIFLAGRNMEKARKYFDELEFEVYTRDNTVFVKSETKNRSFWKRWNWNRKGGARITVQARIPVEFNTNLKTSGGDVTIIRLHGETNLSTSGGDIELGELIGSELTIRTSGGDIEAENLDGRVLLKTSGGDIEVGNITGPAIKISTSGGDIEAGTLDADEISVKTSGGDIELREVDGNLSTRTSGGDIDIDSINGDLEASTSGGSIEVKLERSVEVNLRTSGGNIEIDVPESFSADIDLRGERVYVDNDFQFKGRIKKNYADGRINGGGPQITASTSGGKIVLKVGN